MHQILKYFFTHPKHLQNTFQNQFNNVAYLYYFPPQWKIQNFQFHFDPYQSLITKVIPTLNRLGQNQGKYYIEFIDQNTCDNFIQKYHQKMVDVQGILQRVLVKKYQLRNQKVVTHDKRSPKWFKLTNLPFQATELMILNYASDFGQITKIQMPFNRIEQRNKGFVFLKFKQLKSAQQFKIFIEEDGQFLGRKLQYEHKNFKGFLCTKESSKKSVKKRQIKSVLIQRANKYIQK